MKRVLLGLFVIVHGCAHAAIGVWALGDGSPWVVSPLWGVSMLGYFAAGLGILRVPFLRGWWKQLLVTATVASLILLLAFSHGLSLIGALIDMVIIVFALERQQRCIDSDVDVVNALGADCFEHPALHRAVWGMSVLALMYATVIVVIRPLSLAWGTTASERFARLPGDDLAPDARYRIDRAITIHAPASAVWSRLVELGQDSVQAHVADVIPGRALILKNSVALVVSPLDSTTTRLIARTRAPGTPSLSGLLFGAVNVFIKEPAQFLSQRALLRGVRDKSEGAVRS
jgi:hypothetical protein